MKPAKKDDVVISDTMIECLIFLTPKPDKRNRRRGSYGSPTYSGLSGRGLIALVPWKDETMGGTPIGGEVWTITDKGWQWLRDHQEVWGFARTANEKDALSALKKSA